MPDQLVSPLEYDSHDQFPFIFKLVQVIPYYSLKLPFLRERAYKATVTRGLEIAQIAPESLLH